MANTRERPEPQADPYRFNAPGDADATLDDSAERGEVVGRCVRCAAGPPTAIYVIKGKPEGSRELCPACANITAGSHKIKPNPPALEANADEDQAPDADPQGDAAKAAADKAKADSGDSDNK